MLNFGSIKENSSVEYSEDYTLHELRYLDK